MPTESDLAPTTLSGVFIIALSLTHSNTTTSMNELMNERIDDE